MATLSFVLGWLSVNGAAVLCTLLLLTLIMLAWNRFDQGKHPCFLFLCTLMLFQGGRLIAYCLGGVAHPLQVQLMQDEPFSIGRANEGVVLLCLALSAICLYAPCRWNFKAFPTPSTEGVRKYLPYLYLLFFSSLPIQLYKNYKYFEWAQQHGGYSSIYLNHASLVASVPFLVRIIPLVSFPTLVAIFVFEYRKGRAYAAAALYLGAASVILLLGSRGTTFGLVLALWYIARVKTTRRTRIALLALFAITLVLIADAARQHRDNPDEQQFSFLPLEFLSLQGLSLDVLSTVVAYRDYFAPYARMYPFYELQIAFVAVDTAHYRRGRALSYDASVLLNVNGFDLGGGTGGSYIGEAYAIGGLVGVVVISLLIGFGLHLLRALSRSSLTLALVAMMLPEIMLMPRGGLLDWLSVFFRNAISIILLLAGWKAYSLVTSIRRSVYSHQLPFREGPAA
jgi:hypothetical protein